MSDEPSVPPEFLATGHLEAAIRELGVELIGKSIGVYQITSLLGVGGMGEVYRARDTKLGRDVAIKVLPPAFTSDPERLSRFNREARLLATLNHPHIGAIYGLEDASGLPALVLELVEGDSLADRLAKGRVPIPDALRIAKQIAEGLEAAHERGVVHRDLKPANVKMTLDGTVKVLDFGLAKVMTGDSDAPVDQTRPGLILGTAAYMSPEQARGKPGDKRIDIWAFGCVVYEMLTGRQAFPGKSVSDTLVGILDREPDWLALPHGLPPNIRRLLRRCLEKDPTVRLHDVGDARLELDDALAKPYPDVAADQSRRRRVPLWIAGAVLLAAMATVAFVVLIQPRMESPREPFRFSLETPPMPLPYSMAVSPDGRTVVFTGRANEKVMLFAHRIGSLGSSPLAGTEEGYLPFWSPDGRTVGFYQQNSGKLKSIDVIGGELRVVCDMPSAFYGGTWNAQNVIVFGMSIGNSGSLYRVPAAGGNPVRFIEPGPASGEDHLRWPQFLPDGRRFLYQAAGIQTSKRAIFVGSLDGGEPTRLMLAESNAVFARPNTLLFTRGRMLMAQQFHSDTLGLTADPVPIAEDVFLSAQGRAAFAVSDADVLMYRTGEADRSLVWVDRGGQMGKPVVSLLAGNYLTLSPDGKRVAFFEPREAASADDIFVYDMERKIVIRVTNDPAPEYGPIWSPDGSRIAFTALKGDHWAIYERDVDRATAERTVVAPEQGIDVGLWAWHRDFLVFWKGKFGSGGTNEVWVEPQSRDRTRFQYLPRVNIARASELSPNGRWLAYVATEAGTNQVIVQSFPDPTQARHVISSKGGTNPRWSRDGRELFYLGPGARFIAVKVATDGPFKVLNSTELFSAPSSVFDVGSDGQSFLFNVSSTNLGLSPPSTIVLNWAAGLEK